MWPSVQAAWVPINSKWEGVAYWLYADSLGWITTGMGNKVDPLGDALAVKGWTIGGAPASAADITDAWNKVNATVTLPKGQVQPVGTLPAGGGLSSGYQNLTSLRLSSSAVATLVASKLAEFEASLKPHFQNWDAMPADSQFGILSMSWAMGSGFADPKSKYAFPQFDAAINAGQYAKASPLSHMRGNGIQSRNDANAQMFLNAQAVVDRGMDPSKLYYPGAVPQSGGGGGPGSGPPSSVSGGLIVAGLLALAAGGAYYVYRA